MNKSTIIRKAKQIFRCDSAKVRSFPGKHFLIIGWKRNTAKDREENPNAGQWIKDGQPFDFDYVREQTIANGHTLAALWKRAKRYRRLLAEEKLRTMNSTEGETR